jgi:hypothetical protein
VAQMVPFYPSTLRGYYLAFAPTRPTTVIERASRIIAGYLQLMPRQARVDVDAVMTLRLTHDAGVALDSASFLGKLDMLSVVLPRDVRLLAVDVRQQYRRLEKSQ